MTIAELRTAYDNASGKVSELVRQLALAGIAVVWIFRVGDHTGGILWTHGMLLPLLVFVTALGVDLAQYLYQTVLWGCLNTYHWRKYHDNDKEVNICSKWNWPAIGAFWIKVGLCIDAYCHLLYLIYVQLSKIA